MSEFRIIDGFEEVWRSPVAANRRTAETVLSIGRHSSSSGVRDRLARLVARAPEVMVKVTGRTRDGAHLRAHLDYITRKGELAFEDRDGARADGRGAVKDLADDWTFAARVDGRRRSDAPMSLSVVLSMPAGTDATRLRDAARAFAEATFGERFDYAFVLHTDAGHPHVHLAVRTMGDRGERLNPKKADLDAWRQSFARALRDRGIAAEATPRRARGIVLKGERTPMRKMRERHERGFAPAARCVREAYREAGRAAFLGDVGPRPWEVALAQRQMRTRAFYLAQADLLARSEDAADRKLGEAVVRFVSEMPAPASRRLVLARELRAAGRELTEGRDVARDKVRS